MNTVFLAGEGRTELGDWAKEAQYRPPPGTAFARGVLDVLLRKCWGETSFQVLDGRTWKSIVKFRAGEHRGPETRTVLGLCLAAHEARCDVLVFVRDRDGNAERERDVEEGILQAAQTFALTVAGGVAIEAIEAWVLALLGQPSSETKQNPKHALEKHGIQTVAQKVASVEVADFAKLPKDATSLRKWLGRIDCELGRL